VIATNWLELFRKCREKIRRTPSAALAMARSGRQLTMTAVATVLLR
jgi:hypothetical protein